MDSKEAIKEDPGETGGRLPTRLTRRGAERCERIRGVAADLFLTRGYEGVSLDEIILQAGGSKTNIYNHFGDKERLFLAVVEELLDQSAAPLRTLDLSQGTVEEGLYRYGRTLLETLTNDRHLALYRLVIGESARFPVLGRIWLEHGPEVSIRVLTGFLSRPELCPDGVCTIPPRRAATLFHDMLVNDRLLFFGIDRPTNDEQMDRLVSEAVRVFTRGYMPARPSTASPT